VPVESWEDLSQASFEVKASCAESTSILVNADSHVAVAALRSTVEQLLYRVEAQAKRIEALEFLEVWSVVSISCCARCFGMEL